MVEVMRSMTGLSWAAMLFGARQLQNVLLADPDRVTAALDSVVEASRRGLGRQPEIAVRLGEGWQSAVVDRIPLGAPALFARSLDALEGMAPLLGALPGQACAARELANKVAAMRGFEAGGTTRDPYRRLWATEGIGFARSERRWRDGRPPAGLFRDGFDPAAEADAIPLHTGMGLSLAMRTLAAVDTRAGDRPLATALDLFDAACRANAAPGYELIAFEGLGFVVRTMYPHCLQRFDELLARRDRSLLAYYWHGVGRALYFVPTQALPGPGGWRRALGKASREPRHEIGRGNALAGFAWALVLVNLRHPEVLEGLLRLEARSIYDPAALADGVGSALALWARSNGRDRYLEAFLAPRADPAIAAAWRAWVGEPGARAVDALDRLERRGRLGTLFRYRPEREAGAAGVAGTHPIPLRTPCCAPLPLAWSQGVDGWLSRAVRFLSRPTRPQAPPRGMNPTDYGGLLDER